MAHHNNTPQSILDAPAFAPRWFHKHVGPNREQRRHLSEATRVKLFGKDAWTVNVPYVKPKKAAA